MFSQVVHPHQSGAAIQDIPPDKPRNGERGSNEFDDKHKNDEMSADIQENSPSELSAVSNQENIQLQTTPSTAEDLDVKTTKNKEDIQGGY